MRTLLPERQRLRLGGLRRQLVATLAVTPLVRVLESLPREYSVQIMEKARLVKKLDYPRSDIWISLNSSSELNRVHACRKEPETVQWIEQQFRAGDVLFDIGANIGAYSLIAAKFHNGAVKVHSFEPSFSTYPQLFRNVILNDCQGVIFPHMMPLSNRTSLSVFNYSSTEAGTALHSLGAPVDYKGDAFRPEYRQVVLGFCLDDLVFRYGFPPPNHVKLDVDGMELEILVGGSVLLGDPGVRSILVEVCHLRGNASTIMEFLQGKGFSQVACVDHGQGVSNRLFVRNGCDLSSRTTRA